MLVDVATVVGKLWPDDKVEVIWFESQSMTSIDDETTIDALTSLGYSMQESRQVIKKIPDNMINAEDRVKQALKILSGK